MKFGHEEVDSLNSCTIFLVLKAGSMFIMPDTRVLAIGHPVRASLNVTLSICERGTGSWKRLQKFCFFQIVFVFLSSNHYSDEEHERPLKEDDEEPGWNYRKNKRYR